MSFDDVPAMLRNAKQWVARKEKKPCDLQGRSGGWQNSDFWISFEEAKAGIESNPGMFSGPLATSVESQWHHPTE